MDNTFLVGRQGDNVVILLNALLCQPIPRDAALNLAAWIVAVADDENKFPEILSAVQNT